MKLFILFYILVTAYSMFGIDVDKYYNKSLYIRFNEGIDTRIGLEFIKDNINYDSYYTLLKESQTVNYKQKNSSISLQNASSKLQRTFRLNFLTNQNISILIEKLRKMQIIELAEPVSLPKLQESTNVNDPRRDFQLYLNQIRAYSAWEIVDGSPDIIIGISDDGMRPHPDLIGNQYEFTGEIPNNGIDDDQNGYIDDFNSFNLDGEIGNNWGDVNTVGNHGTRVAGIAGAEANNNLGIVGIGNKCKIFPIKISLDNEPSTIPYGYESIIFAADRGIDILNCSWGVDSQFSFVEQSIIDYAVSKGLIIVSSSGNTGTQSINQIRTRKWYPAAYRGVIGVGSVKSNEELLRDNSLGVHLDVMAPGEDAYTTSFNDDYTNIQVTGTSFAAPMVSGLAALLKIKHPELNPFQIHEIIRQTGVQNQYDEVIQGFIPKRIDMLSAISIDPMSIPGIEITNIRFMRADGETERFEVGDELDLKIDIFNHLGDTENLGFTINEVFDFLQGSLEVIGSEYNIESLKSGESKTLNFKVRSRIKNSTNVIFRLNINGEDNYSDFRNFTFIPNVTISDFENSTMIVSVGDAGNLGFTENSDLQVGKGVSHFEYGNPFWWGGLAIFSGIEAFSSFSGNNLNNKNDFKVIKPHTGIHRDSSYYNDGNDNNPLGIEIGQKVLMSGLNSSWLRLNLDIRNPSVGLFNLGIAYFCDWDIGLKDGAFSNNSTMNGEVILPDVLNSSFAGASVALNPDESIFVGMMMFTDEEHSQGFGAGFSTNEYTVSSLSDSDIRNLIRSGYEQQYIGVSDVGAGSGIYFDKVFGTNEIIDCSACFSIAGSINELKDNMLDCYLMTSLNLTSLDTFNEYIIKGNILISKNEHMMSTINVWSVDGRILSSSNHNFELQNTYNLDFLDSGLYFIQIDTKKGSQVLKFLVRN